MLGADPGGVDRDGRTAKARRVVMTSRGFDRLGEYECGALLRSRSFGRVVTKIGDQVMAFPVYYAVIDDDIVFRTDPGTKLGAAVLGTSVVFEVDDEPEGWSVVAVGRAQEIRDIAARLAALDRIGTEWSEGEREHVVRIHVKQLSGRRLQRHPAHP
jgi:hypothetical protein